VGAELFVDTSAWYAAADRSDRNHARMASAFRLAVRSRRRLVTTNLVVAETHVLLLRRLGRDQALAFVRAAGSPPGLVVESSVELERAAVAKWLEAFADQDFSYTDAVSFAVMASRGISEALTLDHHFSVAGFTRVAAVDARRPRS
jgi:predicted nucleic acid-binding protein